MAQNMFERAIAAVAPTYALKRATSQAALRVLNSGYGNYGANLTKKSMRGWNFSGGSAKEDIEDNLSTLRQRSRDAYMGVPTATAAIKTMRTNVVAGGLVPSPNIDGDFLRFTDDQMEKLQKRITREFDLWADAETCDVDGLDNFYQLQKLAYLSFLMNGDVFALLEMVEDARTPYALKIKIIEADRICSPDGFDRIFPCEVKGRKVFRIVQGVETGKNGEVLAYWVCNRHPLSSESTVAGSLEWVRVEAYGKKSGRKNILHVMTRERAEQVRGVPLLAPVLEALKQMGRYTEAEITAAVLSAMFTVFVKQQVTVDGQPFGEMLPPDQMIDPDDQNTIELGPGAILSLNPGEDVQFADPKHPNSGYDTFTDEVIKQIGAALEIPTEVMMKQFTTSYSAARGALNEFWRTCQMQRDDFVADFCQPIYEAWFAEAVARERIYAPGFFVDPIFAKSYTGCTWSGPARTNLNPVQEVNAAIERVNAGFSTAQEETVQMTGGDYNRNIRQRIIEAKQMKDVMDILTPVQPEETNNE